MGDAGEYRVPDEDFNVTDPIFEWAQRAPYAVAVIDGDTVVHYCKLCTAVVRAMATFREAGWEAGQVIAISMGGNFALQLVISIALTRYGVATSRLGKMIAANRSSREKRLATPVRSGPSRPEPA